MSGKNWVLVGVGVMLGIMFLGWWRDQQTSPATTPGDRLQEAALENTIWQLQDYAGETGFQTVIPGTMVTAEFADGTLTGKTGCNSYFGSFEVDGNELTISQTGSTMMACDPPVMEQEQAYLTLLSQVQQYALKGSQLTLLNDKGQRILIYIEADTIGLENTLWQATGVNNGKGGVTTTTTTEFITAHFADGAMTGSSGCNSYSAAYSVNGEYISIGPVAGTMKACDEATLMAQEAEYLEALERVEVYDVVDNTLELRDEAGSLQVSYTIKSE